MRELLIILVVVAVIAVIWYLRRRSSGLSAQPKSIGQQGLTGEVKPAKDATVAAQATPPETGPPPSVPGAVGNRAGLFQDAAASAAGAPYVRAADQIEEMTADLSHARRDAERAAERLANRASEALEVIRAAAAVDGGVVPGDGSDRCPPRYPVKGDLATMRYRNLGAPTYDEAVPDVCFQSAAAAEAAGLTESGDESRL